MVGYWFRCAFVQLHSYSCQCALFCDGNAGVLSIYRSHYRIMKVDFCDKSKTLCICNCKSYIKVLPKRNVQFGDQTIRSHMRILTLLINVCSLHELVTWFSLQVYFIHSLPRANKRAHFNRFPFLGNEYSMLTYSRHATNRTELYFHFLRIWNTQRMELVGSKYHANTHTTIRKVLKRQQLWKLISFIFI